MTSASSSWAIAEQRIAARAANRLSGEAAIPLTGEGYAGAPEAASVPLSDGLSVGDVNPTAVDIGRNCQLLINGPYIPAYRNPICFTWTTTRGGRGSAAPSRTRRASATG